MEVITCMSPEQLVELLIAGKHTVLSYEQYEITTIADKVYTFLLDTKDWMWCHVDVAVSA